MLAVERPATVAVLEEAVEERCVLTALGWAWLDFVDTSHPSPVMMEVFMKPVLSKPARKRRSFAPELLSVAHGRKVHQ